jgi:uncharacterized membrane protein YfcA
MDSLLFLLFFNAIVAFALSAVCGGGAGFLLMPLLGMSLPAAQVPAALSIGTVTSSISRISIFWKNIRWDIVAWFVPPALPAVWFGAKLLTYVNPVYLQLVIGLFLLINLPLIFKPNVIEKPKKHPQKILMAIIGLLAGFVSGLTGAIGLLFNKFYYTQGLTKEEIVATRAANEVLLQIVKLILYALFGLMTLQSIAFGAVIAVAAVLSAWIMKNILPKVSAKLFQQIGYATMVVSGLFIFGSAANTLVVNKDINVRSTLISGGMETKLFWRNGIITMEFEFDEGFEFERTIKINELPAKQQAVALRLTNDADKVIIEEVYGIGKHFYEAYAYRNNKLTKYTID